MTGKSYLGFSVPLLACVLFLVWFNAYCELLITIPNTSPSIFATAVTSSPNSQSTHSEVTLSGTKLVYGDTQALPQPFKPALNESESLILTEMLAKLHDVMKQANITYFIAGGTLLGSWRHHGFIPWDDDVDVYIRNSDKPHVGLIKSGMAPKYQLYDTGYRWKVFLTEGTVIPRRPRWRFPFIDLCVLDENAGHMWDIDPVFSQRFSFPKSWIFPLRLRPFNGLMLWAPHDTNRMINKSYDPNECLTHDWVHRTESYPPASQMLTMPCSKLKKAYPFVLRYANHTLEALQLDGRNISFFDPK